MQSDGNPPRIRARVAAACDACKARKVKCNGLQPCSFCLRRSPERCHYSLPSRPRHGRRTRTPERSHTRPLPEEPPDGGEDHEAASHTPPVLSERTHVPREGALVGDSRGKLMFIGDSAPLSFLQTVKRLLSTRIGPNAFASSALRDQLVEQVPARSRTKHIDGHLNVRPDAIDMAVGEFLAATSGLIYIFDRGTALRDIRHWLQSDYSNRTDALSAVNYLVLAIGHQNMDSLRADAYFRHARRIAFDEVADNVSVSVVVSFLLITIYMLRGCERNGAFLYFALAARGAYALGVHRSEVNAFFGPDEKTSRGQIWKSLRVLDLFLSSSLGRPPATSDIDCTIGTLSEGPEQGELPSGTDTLESSLEIFLVIERIIIEIYSRKDITVHLTQSISKQLRIWAEKWLQRHRNALSMAQSTGDLSGTNIALAIGSCQAICSYYYAIMLLTRPFLVYELDKRLSRMNHAPNGYDPVNEPEDAPKMQFADACIDSALAMTDTIQKLTQASVMPKRMPLLVSWLHTAALVMCLAYLGGFVRGIQSHIDSCIAIFDDFAVLDPQAASSAMTVRSLYETARRHIAEMDARERQNRAARTSLVFGIPEDRFLEASERLATTRIGVIDPASTHPHHPRPDLTTAPSEALRTDPSLLYEDTVDGASEPDSFSMVADFLGPGIDFTNTLDGGSLFSVLEADGLDIRL